MLILNTFNQFLQNQLFENKNELEFRITDRLRDILKEIDHPISNYMLIDNRDSNKKKITVLDYHDTDYDKFIFIPSNKVLDGISKKTDLDSLTYYKLDNVNNILQKLDNLKVTTTIGRTINKLYPNEFKASGEPGKDIESFINEFKSKRSAKFDNIKIIEGEDIIKYYYYESYSEKGGGSLHSSCMRHGSCSEYLEFYSKNNIKMIVLFSDTEDDKIIGRALLWDIDEIDDKKVENVKFMDRIYYIQDYIVNIFKEYANKNGWLSKSIQDSSQYTSIFDPKTNEHKNLKLKTKNNFERTNSNEYPYLDTFKYYYHEDMYLSNKEEESKRYYFLNDTGGDFQIVDEDRIYIDYYGDYYHTDDLVWCEYGHEYRLWEDSVEYNDEYATNDYAREHLIWSNIQDRYLSNDETIWLSYYDDYVTSDYASSRMYLSKKDDTYYKASDCEWSDYYDTYINEDNSELIYTNMEKTIEDYRIKDDGTYITIKTDEDIEYYDIDLMNNFITVITDMENPNKNLKWDFKDNAKKYIKIKDRYYLKKFEDELTGQLKIKFDENEKSK